MEVSKQRSVVLWHFMIVLSCTCKKYNIVQNIVKILLMEYVYINVNYGIESIQMSTRGGERNMQSLVKC